MLRQTSIVWILGIGLLLAVLAGCSGNSKTSATNTVAQRGSAVFTIDWPSRSKAIPTQADSIVVRILQNGSLLTQASGNRPWSSTSSEIAFADLPAGTLAYTVEAHDGTNGGGTVLATANGTFVVRGGERTTVAITANLTNSIDQLVMSAPNGSLSVTVGGTLPLTATALNAAGQVLPVAAGSVVWSSSNPISAPVDAATGVVSGIAACNAVITAREVESGKTVQVTITVTDLSARLTINPLSGTTATLFTFEVQGWDTTAQAQTPVEARWDWDNDGTFDTPFSSTLTADNQYDSTGTFVVRVQIRDASERVADATGSITVGTESDPITLTITAAPSDPIMLQPVVFTVSARNKNGIIKQGYLRFDWDNDGIYDTEFKEFMISASSNMPATGEHHFGVPGVYTVRAQVKEMCGRVGSGTYTITVRNL